MKTVPIPEFELFHYGKQGKFIETLESKKSPTALSALDSLDAAFWLLSRYKISQSLFLFHHSIELTLKGLLEEVHIILTADRPDYNIAKWIAKERLANHALGQRINVTGSPEQYDPRRTCNFETAFKRVSEMIDFPSETSKSLKKLNNLRNEIVHFGDKGRDIKDCIDVILNIIWPFLKSFYQKAYDLKIEDFIFHPLAREINIAQGYFNLTKENKALPVKNIFHPFSIRKNLDHILGSANLLIDEKGYQIDLSEERFEINQKIYDKFDSKWSLLGKNVIDCVICGDSEIIVSVYHPEEISDKEIVYAEALYCPHCGLNLDESYEELARLHFGPITEERLGKEAWKNEVPR